MNTNYISKFFNGAIFSGVLFLVLLGISAFNVTAQAKAKLTVDKAVCDDIGQQNTCNGANGSLAGQTIEFSVTNITTNPGVVEASIFVTINQGNDAKSTSGTTTTGNDFTVGDRVRVCEVLTPMLGGFDSVPRPGDSTGGQQTIGGPGFEDCIELTINNGNNVTKFINDKIELVVTAAQAMVAGRVLIETGKFRGSVLVTILNTGTLETQTVQTNRLGYYQFEDLTVGDTYIVTVRSKGFTFAPEIFTLNDDNALDMRGYAVGRSGR